MGFEGHPFSDVMSRKTTIERQRIQAQHKGKQKAHTAESGLWNCSHNPFTGRVTAKICRDKEVGKVGRCFDVSIDIGEVAVLAIEISKEEETWRRGTMGMLVLTSVRLQFLQSKFLKRKKLGGEGQWE